MTREIRFLLVLLLHTIGGLPIGDYFVVDLSRSSGNYTIKYDFVSPKGNGTCTSTVDWTSLALLRLYSYPFLFNCTDPLPAAQPHTTVGEKIDFDLGTLVYRGIPYSIKISLDNGYCLFSISPQSFPRAQPSYCWFFHEQPNVPHVGIFNSYGTHTVKYDFVSPKGNGTCTFKVTVMSQGWDPSIEPINCKDPQAAALPHTIVAEKVDFYLGTLVSRRAPYTIRIDFDAGHCILVLPLQSFPLNKGSYCVKQPIGDGHNNIVVDLDNSYRNHTIKYGFVSSKGYSTCTFTAITSKDVCLQPTNCTDPLAAEPPHTIGGENFDIDLGTLDSRGAPYNIRINFGPDYCRFTLTDQSFPMGEISCSLGMISVPLRRYPIRKSLTPKVDCVNNWIPPPYVH